MLPYVWPSIEHRDGRAELDLYTLSRRFTRYNVKPKYIVCNVLGCREVLRVNH